MTLVPRPADVIDGADPTIKVVTAKVKAFRRTCQECGWSSLEDTATGGRMDEHLYWGHPATRNPELTCHAAPPWDHERICVRAKGHEGDHWTFSGFLANGGPVEGATWPQPGRRAIPAGAEAVRAMTTTAEAIVALCPGTGRETRHVQPDGAITCPVCYGLYFADDTTLPEHPMPEWMVDDADPS